MVVDLPISESSAYEAGPTIDKSYKEKETNKDKALLCLDPGTKNIGIAISDINKKVATPIEVIQFTKYMDLKNTFLGDLNPGMH